MPSIADFEKTFFGSEQQGTVANLEEAPLVLIKPIMILPGGGY